MAFIWYALKLSVLQGLCALVIAFALSGLFNLLGLWLDTANPRLRWDNPLSALKQNPNSIIAILGEMGLTGGLGALAFVLHLTPLGNLAVFGLVPAGLFGILLALYPRYARKRIVEIEP